MTAASKRGISRATASCRRTSGSSHNRTIALPAVCPASTSISPRDRVPSPYSAQMLALSTLTGHTCPAQPSNARRPSTAARKSPLYCSIIDNSRLPPVWPRSRACSSIGSRDRRTRRASRSLRASASAHLSTSPGGSTPSSSRSCPELPPLSNIVTTAFRLSQGLLFKPPSRLGSPVPPPKQPMFSVRSCIRPSLFHSRRATARTHGGARFRRIIGLMDRSPITPVEREALEGLAADLRRIFGSRLLSLVAYGMEKPA